MGRKRIGVAVGQSFTGSASPLTQINVDAAAQYWEKIAELIREWKPIGLVVGHPLSMDDGVSSSTKLATRFAKQLEQRFGLPVHLVDERLSTREAIERLTAQGKKRYTKEQLNSTAAQVILETFLNQANTSSV